MTWNDAANVCGGPSYAAEGVPQTAEPVTETASEATNPVEGILLINIDKATQKMRVLVDGVQHYEWPVSTGLRGYTTPSGTFAAKSMNKIWYSRQWDNAPMPHAVFFTKDGHAIHATNETKRLGKPASHGCVRLPEHHASYFYDEAEIGTPVRVYGKAPYGSSSSQSPRRRSAREDDSFPERPVRRVPFFYRVF